MTRNDKILLSHFFSALRNPHQGSVLYPLGEWGDSQHPTPGPPAAFSRPFAYGKAYNLSLLLLQIHWNDLYFRFLV